VSLFATYIIMNESTQLQGCIGRLSPFFSLVGKDPERNDEDASKQGCDSNVPFFSMVGK